MSSLAEEKAEGGKAGAISGASKAPSEPRKAVAEGTAAAGPAADGVAGATGGTAEGEPPELQPRVGARSARKARK